MNANADGTTPDAHRVPAGHLILESCGTVLEARRLPDRQERVQVRYLGPVPSDWIRHDWRLSDLKARGWRVREGGQWNVE